MNIKRFKKNAKFRLIHGPVHVYVTANQIRNGIGDNMRFNAATQKALDAFEFARSGSDVTRFTVGMSGTWEGLAIQLDYMGS